MKKAVKKITPKANEKESDIEMLARIVQDGFIRVESHFEQVDKRFEQMDKRFEQVDKRFEQMDKRFEQGDIKFEGIQHQIASIHHELKDHTVRLERIERKQLGMLVSIDENIHRSEFKNLASRVEVLEKKSIKTRH
jgi:predicted  nucleic acid-binding Zn-ribbon protein